MKADTRRPLADTTRAVHAGRHDLAELGLHAPPIDLSSTYPTPDLEAAGLSMGSLGAGGRPKGSFIYSRMHNPTVARFEDGIAEMEGAEAAVAFGSGMAAITAALLAAADNGKRRHVLAVRPLYGGTDHLLEAGTLGLDVTFTDAAHAAEHIRPETGLAIAETPGNPTLDLIDIRALATRLGDVPLMLDNTFSTPILQNPLAFGAALALHSATKAIGGHGDVLAGVIACSEAWAERLRKVRVLTGAVLHPLAAYLLHRGLPTLPLRVRAMQATAQVLAERLAAHPGISRVLYPGLRGADPNGLLGRQMRGPGSIMAFEVEGGIEAAARMMKTLQIVTPAVSLGSTDSLIQHPAALTHRSVPEAARLAEGITGGLLRLSVGLEDVEDLWADLEAGLAAARDVAAGTHELTHA
ncbi:MAG: PLP-dependent transferase [Vicinamibacteria bacterium]|nr:PLP-dependent transferase [Vicinamibacteria bacterium]